MTLPTNFVDDVLDDSMQGKRQYEMIENANDTVSLVDVTEYEVEGSTFGANAINQTNEQVNENTSKIGEHTTAISGINTALNGTSFSYNTSDQHFYATRNGITKKLGSGEGNATASQVLNGVTFTSGQYNDVTTGTMPNRGAVSQSLNPSGSYTIPAGYHNGSGKVTAKSVKVGYVDGIGGGSVEINLSGVSGYRNFVLWQNLFVRVTQCHASHNDANFGINISYNSSTGIVSVTGNDIGNPNRATAYYLYY